MSTTITFLTVLAVAAVGVILVAGLLNMARGQNVNLSQKLMRWRVGLQFVAVVVIMTALFISNHV